MLTASARLTLPSQLASPRRPLSGVVELADAILIMQSIANPDKYGVGGKADKPITDQGKLNGNVDDDVVGLTANDALKIQKYLLHIISNL